MCSLMKISTKRDICDIYVFFSPLVYFQPFVSFGLFTSSSGVYRLLYFYMGVSFFLGLFFLHMDTIHSAVTA